MIKCLTNNKIYIGGTKLFSLRRGVHFSSLKRNKHHNRYLQDDFIKFGENNFIFDIISVEHRDNLSKAEQYWIDFYSSCDPALGYNIRSTAGHYPNEYDRQILSSNAIKRMGRKFSILTPAGELVEDRGLKRFCEKNKLDRWGIFQVLDGQIKQFKGWRLPTTKLDPEFFDDYQFISPDGKLLKVKKNELKEFCRSKRFHSRDYIGLLEVWVKKTNYNNGWTRYDNPNHAIFENQKGEIVYVGRGVYMSYFAKLNNIAVHGLKNLIYGRIKKHKGWSFKGWLNAMDTNKLEKY